MQKPPVRREKLTAPGAHKAFTCDPKRRLRDRLLGGGYHLKGYGQFVALTEADQVAVQHIR